VKIDVSNTRVPIHKHMREKHINTLLQNSREIGIEVYREENKYIIVFPTRMKDKIIIY